jgi:hypothetical protein
MPSDQIIFTGVEFSSGRKPVTFAVLDEDLNIQALETWDITETLSGLKGYDSIWAAVNVPAREGEGFREFKKQMAQSGFKPYSDRQDSRQLLLTNAQDCFRALGGHTLLPRRSLEGRLQRTAILYEQGLPLKDPIDVFEEITRFKLIQGILPLEDIYSSKQLDALAAAYLTWLAVNRPGQIVRQGEFALPAGE